MISEWAYFLNLAKQLRYLNFKFNVPKKGEL